MKKLLLKLCSTIFLPAAWTILTIVLLCIPGSDLPTDSSFVFQIDGFDKFIHVILFGGLVLFWGFYLKRTDSRKEQRFIVIIILSSIALGIILEFIQLFFIPDRSFDKWDILADSAGAVLLGGYHIYLR